MNIWESEKVIDLIKKNEGLRFKLYKCSAGKLTIGFGRNLESIGISIDEAILMRTNDLKRCSAELSAYLPWWIHHPETIQLVLMDMCYNLGINKLLEFKRPLSLIRDQKYIEASSEMMRSKWAKQVTNRAAELSEMLKNAGQG